MRVRYRASTFPDYQPVAGTIVRNEAVFQNPSCRATFDPTVTLVLDWDGRIHGAYRLAKDGGDFWQAGS